MNAKTDPRARGASVGAPYEHPPARPFGAPASHPQDLDALAGTLAGTGETREPGDDDRAGIDSGDLGDRQEAEQHAERQAAERSISTIGIRTSATLEQYEASIVENIAAVRARLDTLERLFVEDAAQVKERIGAHMSNGNGVTEMMQGIEREITELERRRGDMLSAHARGSR